ncbi:ABC transporter permease [Peloplasma aerotolerans]|uniref:ABC transporter permease n=1 Tax=Peloplasma aerotolerans TaxID=3044389 RepID=A0AAW6U9P2_9MOLU|nr:ABC transporter permease [Mariniplasma sp. M4Ah]MDI6453610.1 ABC transporter permease [Mariniplasma sp. M4Ah]MDR4968387.1 ABC transporter permease [Acholeplasmataceae bacterium]
MSVIFRIALKRIFKQRLTLALMGLLPLVLIFLPRSEGLDTTRISYGIFGLITLFATFMLTKQVIEDRQSHTIIRIAASPITHKDYLMGHLSAYMSVMFVQVTLFWIISYIVWRGVFTFYLWAYLLMLCFTVMAICFSLFWHTLFKTYATSIAVYSIVANLMAVMGGMSLPLEYLPERLRLIAIILPTYWYAYGLELAALQNYVLVILCLLILLGFAIIFVTIGSKRRLE